MHTVAYNHQATFTEGNIITLFKRKRKAPFLGLPFFEEECRSVNFGPSVSGKDQKTKVTKKNR